MLVPSHCAQIFESSKRGVQVFSYLFSCFGLSSIAGSFVQSFILNKTQGTDIDGYSIIFLLASLMNLTALIVLLSYSKLINSEKDQNCF